MRYLFWLVILVIVIFAGYQAGRIFTKSSNDTRLIENYSFVREIAELSSLEVRGTTTLSSTNITNDGSIGDELRRLFAEKTVHLSAPYTAKFGVDLKDSSLRIVRTDSLLKIYLPQPKLLSYEIQLDRLETNNRKGLLQFQNDETYISFQKTMYAEGRTQLENNSVFLNRSRDKICAIIQKYFVPLNVRTTCIYEESILDLNSPMP